MEKMDCHRQLSWSTLRRRKRIK